MKESYQAVVIGGGIVGASALYHLSKFGWSNVLMVERSELTSGSTWHAAADYHGFNADPNVAALQAYTIELYEEIEKESGHSCGKHKTGGVMIASTPERWEAIKTFHSTLRAMGIERARLVSPEEVDELTKGLIVTKDVLGGLFNPEQGHVDPSGTTNAYVGAAKKRGAEVVTHNRVLELRQRADDSWDVVTEQGSIHTQHVVNAAGLWAKQVGEMVGVSLPVMPYEHHYLVTESINQIKELDEELPTIVDPEALTYMRQEGQGLLLGLYETNPKPWNVDGVPWNYGMDLIPEDMERIGDELMKGFERSPALSKTGIKRWVNGAFTFTPDGNPLIGPVGPKGFWVACGVMAGFSQGGGVGKALAEWMVHGRTEEDVFSMDVCRFGDYCSNIEYLRETSSQFYARRFRLAYPNEQLPAGRPYKISGAHVDMSEAGARWGNNWGMEMPLYFAPSKDFIETGTLHRSEAFDVVAKECEAVASSAGLMDITAYSRYEVKGPNAQAWLSHLLACAIPGPGRVKLAPMLAEDGRLKGDLTCLNWGDGTYWLMGSYYLRGFHMRWFNDHLQGGVEVNDLSEVIGGFTLSGPNSRKILSQLIQTDLEQHKMMSCFKAKLGMFNVRLARMSLSGELAYEINCQSSEHAALRRTLLASGESFGIKEIGSNAVLSMRLEKGIGIWSREFTQGYTPGMTGLDRWIDWNKTDFIGKSAAQSAEASTRLLVMLEVDADDADSHGFEPVLENDRVVGMTTSGGYGHRLQQSFAMALIDRLFAQEGQQLSVHIAGKAQSAVVVGMSPYNPSGDKMRL
ncbi:MAG: FAD-dependent oxidoreductase [Gammaproteobacteria bacterium]|nr:FAD-dependent oxidoreductase [Gammaproteobacteria bacterium]